MRLTMLLYLGATEALNENGNHGANSIFMKSECLFLSLGILYVVTDLYMPHLVSEVVGFDRTTGCKIASCGYIDTL
jgi:hypothetical protein